MLILIQRSLSQQKQKIFNFNSGGKLLLSSLNKNIFQNFHIVRDNNRLCDIETKLLVLSFTDEENSFSIYVL